MIEKSVMRVRYGWRHAHPSHLAGYNGRGRGVRLLVQGDFRVKAAGWAVMVGVLCGVGFHSGTASSQTLDEALAAAYSNNPELRAQRASLRATDEQVPQALSGWRPDVSGSASAGRRKTDPDNDTSIFTGTQRLNPRFASVEFRQPLFRGGRTVAATRAAENEVLARRSQLFSVEQDTLRDAASAFSEVYRDQAVLDLQIRNEQRLARQLEATRDRFEVGEVTRTDVFQAEARLARATADRVEAEGNLEGSRARYRQAVGETPGLLGQPGITLILPVNGDQAVDLAADQNPVVVFAEYRERSALDQVDQARGELFPEVDFTARAETGKEQARENAVNHEWSALFNLRIPFYQQGQAYSQVRQQKQVAAQRRREINSSRRQAVQEAKDAWARLEAARAAVRSRTKEVKANEVALEGVQQEAQVGARTVLDILDAEQELVNAQVELVRAEANEVISAFDLKRAVGELSAGVLDLPVEIYNPEVHYREVRDQWFGTSAVGDVNEEDFGKPD